jgi:hypothetical protein
MTNINWIQVGAGFLSGGAFGALIKQFFDYRKSRIQTVTFNIELTPFFNKPNENSLASKFVIKDHGVDFRFEDLFIGKLTILNTSNQDYPDFSFGMTYSNANRFIQIQQQKIDRHHKTVFDTLPTLNNQVQQFDISVKPFNRKDNYNFDFIINVTDLENVKNLTLSTSHPVKLKEVTSITELATLIPTGLEISLPFLKLSYTK